ncbi:MAG: MBL fold metallo-hydrolase [Myxococcota bacterium]
MSVREIVVLGSGAERATPERALHGYLLRWDDEGIMLDPGEGSQRRMIGAEVTATSLTRVFLSRFRADCCLGFAGLTQRISLDRVPQAVTVWFPGGGRVYYDRLRKASVYHAAARLDPSPIEGKGQIHARKGLSLIAAPLIGEPEGYGLRLQEPDGRTMLPEALREAGVVGPEIKRLQTEGRLDKDGRTIELDEVSVFKPGHSVAYLPETGLGPSVETLLRDADVALVHAGRSEPTEGAMSAAQVGEAARRAQTHRLVLTGFRPEGPAPEQLEAEAKEAFGGEVGLAFDGRRIPIPRRAKGART